MIITIMIILTMKMIMIVMPPKIKRANLLMQVILGIIMILDGYHDHNDDDHHDDHHYQYDNENCVADDYVELNKK